MTPAAVFRFPATAVVFAALGGWVGGVIGAGVAVALAVLVVVLPWHGQPLSSWAWLFLRRNKTRALEEPVMIANDRSGGGVRYQDGVAVSAVQVFGRPHRPTFITGSAATRSDNTIDVSELVPLMNQSLGLTVESLSLVVSGLRRPSAGDYARVYDTLIGTPPYAGQRETWLILRIPVLANGDALKYRPTVGTAAVAAAQRVAATLRCRGIRAKTATATEILDLERRLGADALAVSGRRWRSVRADRGWLTSYAYRPTDLTAQNLSSAWGLQADGITQNITLFADGTASATVTVLTPQPPTTSPSVVLRTLPGEQAPALAAHLCGPRPTIRGLARGRLGPSLVIPAGPSGVLLGKVADGNRMLLPIGDGVQSTRIHIAAEDPIAKRLIIRAAGSGERITVHSSDIERWESLRMPNLAVTDRSRPAPGTTVSVVDGTVSPAPRPSTVISVGSPEPGPAASADVTVEQTGPSSVRVTVSGDVHDVEMELFRAENRYVRSGRFALESVG